MFLNYLLVLCYLVPMSIQYGYPRAECRPPALPHGRVRLRQRAKMARFMCQPRYELVGSRYATCRDGVWDEEVPVCVHPGCELPQIADGLALRRHGGAWLVFFCSPGYRLAGPEVIYCDGVRWNASAPQCVDTKAPPILSCDFESPDLCGWTQDELHNFDWTRYNKKTPSSFLWTGPSYDHTLGIGQTGHYMYIESTSRRQNDAARLISPEFESSLAKGGCFSFFYHMYGTSIGGLRVYQKPLSANLTGILLLPEPEKQKYLLFEKWHNQGDRWYRSVNPLKDFSENFQIVIEGVRGSSFTSDIAIDDVSVMTADSCSRVDLTTSTAAADPIESCADRCEDDSSRESRELRESCACAVGCVSDGNCCPDYFDVCVFPAGAQSTTEDSSNTSLPESYSAADLQPKTEKLVATTTLTSKTTITTPKTTTQITTTTKTTTASPTTKLTTRKPTTRKIATTIKTTTAVHNTTELKTTVKVTTQHPVTTHPTTTLRTTEISGVSRTIDNHNQYHDLVEQARKKNIEKKNGKVIVETPKTPKKSAGSAIATTLIVLLALATLAAAFALVRSRSPRACVEFARVRGRATNDPEVRYLNSEDNDD